MISSVRPPSVIPSAAMLAVLGVPVLAGNVLVVDASGGGDHTSIQVAIDVAVDGDTILVKSGTYENFRIDDKTVAVVADTGAHVNVTNTVRIENLAIHRDALLVGLRVVDYPGGGMDAGLRARINHGSVRVDGCRLTSLGYLGNGARVEGSRDVVIAGSELRSGTQVYPGDALRLTVFGESRAAVYDSWLRGGDSTGATDEQSCARPDGGDGADVRSPTFLFAAGSALFGGDGGESSAGGKLGCACGGDGGRGGNGVNAFGGSVALLDNRYHGGAGGPCRPGSCPRCQDGWPGQDVVGNATFFEGRARQLVVGNPQREGSTILVEARGLPGDQVYLFLSQETGYRYLPGLRGVQVTGRSGPSTFLGRIPRSGILVKPFPIPDLGPGVESTTIHLQAVHRAISGAWTLGSPVSLVVLDRAF